MLNILFVFILTLSALYVCDRFFTLVKCFRKSEQYTQKGYERLLTFLAVAILITALLV